MKFKVIYSLEEGKSGEILGFCKPESLAICSEGRGQVSSVDLDVAAPEELKQFIGKRVNHETLVIE